MFCFARETANAEKGYNPSQCCSEKMVSLEMMQFEWILQFGKILLLIVTSSISSDFVLFCICSDNDVHPSQ